jgi:transposase
VEIRRGGSGAGDSGGGRLDRVFGLGPATKIYVAVEAVDMRKGFEGLYGLVRDQLRHDPLSGHLFLFTNKTKTRLKALVWDGSGLWVCAKRLEKGASAGRKSKARTASRYARRSWRCW